MIRRLAKRTIFEIQPYVPGKPIEEVKRELGLTRVIKLASNENSFGPSPQAFRAISRAFKQVNRYPDSGCYHLRRMLSRRLRVAPEQLVFGNGSDEIIVLTVRAFVREGDEVVMAKPSFLIYEIASKIAGAVIKAVGLKDFCYDLQAMKRAVTPRTKVVFLGNPDNPSGKYFTQKQMEDFLKGLRNNVLVFVDEAYYEYVRARDYVDSVRLLKTHKNVIIARTFSKMYGLAGLRIGYGIADEEVIACLNRIREPFNVNTLAQAAAIACLNDQRYYKDVARKVERQRRWLYDNLRKLDLKCIESYTNFVLIDGLTDATIIAGRLLKKGIIVRDMRPWGLNNCIRVTIGTEPENRKFLKALKEIL